MWDILIYNNKTNKKHKVNYFRYLMRFEKGQHPVLSLGPGPQDSPPLQDGLMENDVVVLA